VCVEPMQVRFGLPAVRRLPIPQGSNTSLAAVQLRIANGSNAIAVVEPASQLTLPAKSSPFSSPLELLRSRQSIRSMSCNSRDAGARTLAARNVDDHRQSLHLPP